MSCQFRKVKSSKTAVADLILASLPYLKYDSIWLEMPRDSDGFEYVKFTNTAAQYPTEYLTRLLEQTSNSLSERVHLLSKVGMRSH